DWPGSTTPPDEGQVQHGRRAIVAVALLGNVPLLAYFLDERTGPAVIAATTISGTMVMGLAPILLLGWLPGAGALRFHLAFWPGIAIGAARVVEGLTGNELFPPAINLGQGSYARDLGLNVYGLCLCTAGFLLGALLSPAPQAPVAENSE
ncbi:MAG: Na+/proline symporter, partial [Gemmataceae bacterium]